jgi:sulfate transport system substrate-binding protein
MLRNLLLAALLITPLAHADGKPILNVSYDVTREFFKEFNPKFVNYWKQKSGQAISVNQSHGGSSKQARAVVDGLEADVITMNQPGDIDILYQRGKLLPQDWQKRLPHASSPFTSTTVFLVRKGNPKKIKDWEDLAKPGVAVVIPNPKTSGNGKYSYLAAWGFAQKTYGSDAKARDFVGRLFRNVPVLDAGGRGATTTFVQRGIGDALLSFENEVQLIRNELGGSDFEVVYPGVSVLVEAPVAVVDKYVDKHGTRATAQAYLEYLYSEEGQELAAKHYYRPRNEKVFARYAAQRYPNIALFSVDEVFGGWAKAQKTHFDDGGTFDQLYVK